MFDECGFGLYETRISDRLEGEEEEVDTADMRLEVRDMLSNIQNRFYELEQQLQGAETGFKLEVLERWLSVIQRAGGESTRPAIAELAAAREARGEPTPPPTQRIADMMDPAAQLPSSTKYRVRKAKARSHIIRAVSNELVLDLAHTTTAQEAWDELKRRYQPSGMAHRCSTWLEWISFGWDGKDLDKFCSHYKQRLHAMDAIGVTIKEEFRIYMFIQRIEPFFENFAAHLRDRTRDTTDREVEEDQLPFSLDAVIARLLDEQRAKSQAAKVGLLSKTSHRKEARRRQPARKPAGGKRVVTGAAHGRRAGKAG